MPRRQIKPILFTVEEIKHHHDASVDCGCEVCMRLDTYYHVTEDIKEILRRYS